MNSLFGALAYLGAVVFMMAATLGGGGSGYGQLAQVAESLNGDSQTVVDEVNEEGLNPEEVQNVLQYIGDNLKSYGDLLKRLNKANLPGVGSYRAVVSKMLDQIKETKGVLTSAASLDDKREALDAYNNENDWSEIERAGTAADIAERLPQEKKFVSRLNKLVDKLKPPLAGLIGLDVAQLQKTIGDNVNALNQLNSLVAAGNLSEAIDEVRQEGEGGLGQVETLYYQVNDLLSAAQRLNRLKKFPAVAEQVRAILAPVLPDFYADPGGAGSLHQGDENNPSVMDRIWPPLDEAEDRARRRGRKAASAGSYSYLAQVSGSLGEVSAPPPPPPVPAPANQPAAIAEMPAEDEGPIVNFQELEDVKRQIKDMSRDSRRLVKQAGQLGLQAEKTQLEALNNQLNNVLSIVSSPAAPSDDLREAINDFHNERYWDTLNGLRAKIELPKQIKDSERGLRNLGKLLNSKQTSRAAGLFGLNLNAVTNSIAGAAQILQEVKNTLLTDPEEAQQMMSEYWENNPGEAEHAIHRFREAADMLRGIKKNSDLTNQLKSLAQPAAAAFNGGDYREAIELLEEAGNDARRLLNSARKRASLLGPFAPLAQLLSFFLPASTNRLPAAY